MAKYITELQVSLSEHESIPGFTRIDLNLNENPRGNEIYLWYKEGTSSPITRIQFSFNAKMSWGLKSAGFTKVDKNISVAAGGDPIYLWYLSGKTDYDIPIVKVGATLEDDPQIHKLGLERMTCDLDQIARKNQIYLWLKREKTYYLHDITATDSYEQDQQYFNNGYIRVDKSTNKGAGRANVFIWYRISLKADEVITDLGVSRDRKQALYYKSQGFTKVEQNLVDGLNSYPNHIWFKKDPNAPPVPCMNVMFSLFQLPFRRFPKAS